MIIDCKTIYGNSIDLKNFLNTSISLIVNNYLHSLNYHELNNYSQIVINSSPIDIYYFLLASKETFRIEQNSGKIQVNNQQGKNILNPFNKQVDKALYQRWSQD